MCAGLTCAAGNNRCYEESWGCKRWLLFTHKMSLGHPQRRVMLWRAVLCRRAEEGRKERKSRKRNLALLSFGEQAEEEEQDLAAAGTAAKIRSGWACQDT